MVSRNNHARHERQKLDSLGRSQALADLLRYAAYSLALEDRGELELLVTASVEVLDGPGLCPRTQLETEKTPLEALSEALPNAVDKPGILQRLAHILEQASTSWEQAGPGTPLPEAVANCIISVLHESRMLGLRVDPNQPTRPEDW